MKTRLMFVALASSLLHAPSLLAQPSPAPWSALTTTWGTDPLGQPIATTRSTLSLSSLQTLLQGAPLEQGTPVSVSLVMPDGQVASFAVVESPVMEPGLAALFPTIRAYRGTGITLPGAVARFVVTPSGARGAVLHRGKVSGFAPDPVAGGYVSTTDASQESDACELATGDGEGGAGEASPSGPMTLRTYRFALSAPGELTQLAGGTVADVMALFADLVSRTSLIYENELGVRLVLPQGNENLVYLDPATDPFPSPGTVGQLASANQALVASVLGNSGFDVSQAIIARINTPASTGQGSLRSVCVNAYKANGCTQIADPSHNSSPPIRVLAHELGHMFGAEHTFNGFDGLCNQRIPTSAYEPGSGSTLMAYGAWCGSDHVGESNDYFHAHSRAQILAFVSSTATCSSTTVLTNSAPTANAGADYIIPASTPFELTGSGSDPDGDAITYCWEELDLGIALGLRAGDNGSSPIVRSRPATPSPVRTIPTLSDLLAGTFSPGEVLPRFARGAMHFRLTVRDNHTGGGLAATDDMSLQVVQTAGPFRITSPAGGETWSSARLVKWDVAGTTAAPISTANVRILLSTNGGQTYPTILATVPNNGQAWVSLPSVSTTTARIRVEAVGNIFFAICGGNFSITPPATGILAQAADDATAEDTFNNGNANGRLDPGEEFVRIKLPLVNRGTQAMTGVTATVTSLTASATVKSGSTGFADLASGQRQENTSPVVIGLSSGHACGTPIVLRWSVSSDQGPATVDVTVPVGAAPQPGPLQTFSYSGAPITIGSNASGTAQISVSGVSGVVRDADFRFDGPLAGGAGGLQATTLMNTSVKLMSPASRSVLLVYRPQGITGGSPHRFSGLTFDDGVVAPSIHRPIVASGGVVSGNTWGAEPLSRFDGDAPNGTWLVDIHNFAASGTPITFNAATLLIRGQGAAQCESPHCFADFNHDGMVDYFDYDNYVVAYEASEPSADSNADGVIDLFDYLDFVNVYSNGCP